MEKGYPQRFWIIAYTSLRICCHCYSLGHCFVWFLWFVSTCNNDFEASSTSLISLWANVKFFPEPTGELYGWLLATLVILKGARGLLFSFFFSGMWKIRVKKLIITQKPHHSFVIVWLTLGFLGLNCHGVILPGNVKEGSPLHPFGRRYSKESNLTHGPLSRHSPRPTHAPA